MKSKVHSITVGVLLILIGLGMLFYKYPIVILGLMGTVVACLVYLTVYSIVEFIWGRE